AAAVEAHQAQAQVNAGWAAVGVQPFQIGIGLSTGEVAAALLGSEARLEYSLVGDCVNLAQRLQELAGPGQTVLSEATWVALGAVPGAEQVGPVAVKGRRAPVTAYRLVATPGPGR